MKNMSRLASCTDSPAYVSTHHKKSKREKNLEPGNSSTLVGWRLLCGCALVGFLL